MTVSIQDAVLDPFQAKNDRAYSQLYPANSVAERRFRFTRRLMTFARAWGGQVDEQLRQRGQIRSTWECLVSCAFWGAEDQPIQSSVARSVRTDGPNLVRVLDRLENEGLIARVACRTDRRAKCVRVTPAGEAQIKDISQVVDAMRAQIFEGISDAELEQTITTINKVYARLEQQRRP